MAAVCPRGHQPSSALCPCLTQSASQARITCVASRGLSGYFVSAREYTELQRLRALERRAYRLNELPAEMADAIEAAPAHDHLNELLKEK